MLGSHSVSSCQNGTAHSRQREISTILTGVDSVNRLSATTCAVPARAGYYGLRNDSATRLPWDVVARRLVVPPIDFCEMRSIAMTVRFITDREGAGWQVTQIQPAIVGGRRRSYELSQGWLCFSGEDGRRVRVPRELFAGDWRRISAIELRHMLDAALHSGDAPPT